MGTEVELVIREEKDAEKHARANMNKQKWPRGTSNSTLISTVQWEKLHGRNERHILILNMDKRRKRNPPARPASRSHSLCVLQPADLVRNQWPVYTLLGYTLGNNNVKQATAWMLKGCILTMQQDNVATDKYYLGEWAQEFLPRIEIPDINETL